MAISFDAVKNGDVLYDCHKTPMGNTTLRRMGTWRVVVIEKQEHGAICSWNGNPARFFGRRSIEKWRRSPMKRGGR